MNAPAQRLRIVGLHKLPFDGARFAQEVAIFADHRPEAREIFEAQTRENWENAWLVVVEFLGHADELRFDTISHGETPDYDNNQVPWLERILENRGSSTLAAFYLHYVDTAKPLWCDGVPLSWPRVTAPPRHILARMPYESPD